MGEHQLDKLGVTGSSPVPPTSREAPKTGAFRLFLGSKLGPRLLGTQWPIHRFDLGRTAFNDEEWILSRHNVDRLKLDWTFDTKRYADSSPAIVDGIAYFGSDSGYLFAVNATTGAKLWSAPNAYFENSSPGVYGDAVFMIGANMLRARNRLTGALLWESPVPKNAFTHSSPAVVDKFDDLGTGKGPFGGLIGKIIDRVAPQNPAKAVVYQGGLDGLYALDAKTGTQLWKFPTTAAVTTSPAYADGTVFFGTRATVYAIDAKTHLAKWTYATGATPSILSPGLAVANGTVYFPASGTLHALDADTGAVRWKVANPGFTASSPAIANGTIYIGATLDHSLHALDAETGVEKWSFPTLANVAFTSAAVANGVAYIGSYDGMIYAVDAQTGAKLWSFTTGGIIEGSAAVVNGRLYIPSNDFLMYSFSLNGHATPPPLAAGCLSNNGLYVPPLAPLTNGATPGFCRFPYIAGTTYSGKGPFQILCSGGGGPFTTPGLNLPLTGCSGTVTVITVAASGSVGAPGGGTVVAGNTAPVEPAGSCDAACLDRVATRNAAAIATNPPVGVIPPPE